MANEDSQWGIHEKHWRALGDRLAKLSMDTEDWINLGWTAQDRRAKEFSRILTRVLPKSSLIEEHDKDVRTAALSEASLTIRDTAESIRNQNGGEDDTVTVALDLAAKMVESLLDI